MEENRQFRTAGFGGFHRQDVIDYIERTAKEHQTRTTQLEEELNAARAEAAQVPALREELESAREELERIRSNVDKQMAAFERRKQAYAEIELSACRRADQMEDQAREKAASILAEAQEEAQRILTEARTEAESKTAALREELEELRKKRSELFHTGHTELSKNATALKAGVSISLEELDRVRKALEAIALSYDGSVSALESAASGEE